MTDRRWTPEDNRVEPPRGNIPEDYIWVADTRAWYPPGEVPDWKTDCAAEDRLKDVPREQPVPVEPMEEAPVVDNPGRRGCFTRAELLAAGALYCPPEWRKSLGGKRHPEKKEKQRDLFSDLPEDDGPRPAQQPSANDVDDEETEDDASAAD